MGERQEWKSLPRPVIHQRCVTSIVAILLSYLPRYPPHHQPSVFIPNTIPRKVIDAIDAVRHLIRIIIVSVPNRREAYSKLRQNSTVSTPPLFSRGPTVQPFPLRRSLFRLPRSGLKIFLRVCGSDVFLVRCRQLWY